MEAISIVLSDIAGSTNRRLKPRDRRGTLLKNPLEETLMARSTSSKPEISVQEPSVISDPEESNPQDAAVPEEVTAAVDDSQDVDSILNSLKTLLTTVEKLQKVRQEVGDIKPLLVRMLDGELVSGEDLEQLKTGVGGLFRLIRAHSDHQAALAKAQPARSLLDEVLKVSSTRSDIPS